MLRNLTFAAILSLLFLLKFLLCSLEKCTVRCLSGARRFVQNQIAVLILLILLKLLLCGLKREEILGSCLVQSLLHVDVLLCGVYAAMSSDFMPMHLRFAIFVQISFLSFFLLTE